MTFLLIYLPIHLLCAVGGYTIFMGNLDSNMISRFGFDWRDNISMRFAIIFMVVANLVVGPFGLLTSVIQTYLDRNSINFRWR